MYSSQVLRHVAEQIYELYWESGEPNLITEEEDSATLDRGADLKDHKWVDPKSVPHAPKLHLLIPRSETFWSSQTDGQLLEMLTTGA